jgi:putative membrane protein
MLLLLGVYFDVLRCVNNRQWVLLGIFALGCGVGLLLFTRLLKFLLERYHDLTMAFLLGLVIGSLWAIWPFKSFGMAGGRRVDMANILPASFGSNEALTLAAVVAGGAIVAVFIWIESRQSAVK